MLRLDLFLERQQIAYSGSSRNIFTMKEKEQITIPDTGAQEVAKDKATNCLMPVRLRCLWI